MITAVCKDLTEASTFKDLTITNYTGEQLSMEDSLMIYQYLANEAKIQLTEDTPLKDLLAIFDLYKDGAFVEGTKARFLRRLQRRTQLWRTDRRDRRLHLG